MCRVKATIGFKYQAQENGIGKSIWIGFEGSTARRGGIGVGDPRDTTVWTGSCSRSR